MKFIINQSENNFNSFIIEGIQIRFDESTKLYNLTVNFKKDRNNQYTSDCTILSVGDEKQIRDYLINEMHYHKFMGENFLLTLSQKCLSYYNEEVRRYPIGFELNEYQKEAFELLLERRFKLTYVFFNNKEPSNNYYCHSGQSMRYEFSDGVISIAFQKNGEIYCYYVDTNLFHPLYKGSRKYVTEYLKTGKLPIATNARVFEEFLQNNRDIINGRIVEATETPEGTFYNVFRTQCLDSLRLIFNFNLYEIGYAGIDLEKLLSDLLAVKFKD